MKTPPPLPEKALRFKRSVAFADTDAAGVAHFTSLLRYVEEAEHQALKSAGIPIFSPDCGWPRVHLDIDFLHSFTFGDTLEIDIWVEKTGRSSLVWNFQIKKENSENIGAFGQIHTVHVGREGDSLPFTAEERQKLSALPKS